MRVVVVGGGSRPDPLRLMEACQQADCVMAADSGAAWLHAQGLVPDVLLGDFDSLEPSILQACQDNGHTRWVRHRVDKDQTDMELCVEEALRLGASQVRIHGGLGSRMDHSLANLMLLHAFWSAGIPAWVEDATNRITLMGTHGDADGCRLRLEREEGFKVSLLALPPGLKGVCTHGLLYDMRGRDLPFGSTLALSNEFSAPEAEIGFREGLAWVFLSRDEPPQP
jgi:thiamine pyrophosphokinase